MNTRRAFLAATALAAIPLAKPAGTVLNIGTGKHYDGRMPEGGLETWGTVIVSGHDCSVQNLNAGEVIFDGGSQPVYQAALRNVTCGAVRAAGESFLLSLDHVTATGPSWGFDFSGLHTSLAFRSCWAVQVPGQEQPGSRGFRIKNCSGLVIESAGCDHVQGDPLYLESCTGSVTDFWAESCDVGGYVFTISNSRLNIGTLRATANSVRAETMLLRAIAGSRVTINHLLDDDTQAAGTYYTAQTDGRLTVWDYRRSGRTPAPYLADWTDKAKWSAGGFDWLAS